MSKGQGSSSMEMNQAPNRRIYERLVQSEKDLIGLLAYGLYKRHKIGFLQSFDADNKRKPNDGELCQFTLAAGVDDQLTLYRDAATRLLDEFSDELLTEQATAVKDSIYAGSEVIREIKKLDKGLWHDVKANLWAAFISVIVTMAITVSIVAWSIGPESMLRELVLKWADSEAPHQHSERK